MTYGDVVTSVPGLSEIMQNGQECGGCRDYATGYKGDGARIYMDGRTGTEGTLVQIAGRGCEEIITDVHAFFERLSDTGGRCSRVDLAHDIYGRSFDQIDSQLSEGAYTSHLRKWDYMESGTKPGVGDLGRTHEGGNRKSESYMRIYEASIVHRGLRPGTVRVELELKGSRAHKVGAMLAAGEVNEAFGVVRSVIEFRDRSGDSNKARWPISPWWETAIGGAKTMLRTEKEKSDVTLETALEWVDRQCLPTLYYLREALGPEVFNKMIENAFDRAVFKPRFRKALEQIERDRKLPENLVNLS